MWTIHEAHTCKLKLESKGGSEYRNDQEDNGMTSLQSVLVEIEEEENSDEEWFQGVGILTLMIKQMFRMLQYLHLTITRNLRKHSSTNSSKINNDITVKKMWEIF